MVGAMPCITLSAAFSCLSVLASPPPSPAVVSPQNILKRIELPGWAGASLAQTWQLNAQSAVNAASDDQVDAQKLGILREFGCQGVWRKTFQRGQRSLYIDLYQFASSSGAYGAYKLIRQGAATVVTRGDASSEDDQSISFWKDKYVVNLFTSAQDDDEAKSALSQIADGLDKGITDHGSYPRVLSLLPKLERVGGSERIVMGPMSARRFFPAPFIGDLAFDGANAAAVADYKVQEPYHERLKLLLVDYRDANSARRAFDKYSNVISEDNKTVELDPDEYPTSTLAKVSGSYVLCQQRGGQVIVITGAKKKLSPLLLSHNLYY